MATLGLISLNMRANIGEFARDLGKAAARVSDFVAKGSAKLAAFGASAAKMGGAALGLDAFRGQVLALGAALSVAAIGGTLAHMASSSLATVAATGQLADRLGSTTQEVTGLQHAADATGTKVENLGILLEKFSGNVANAAAGTGPAALALRKLGLDATTLLKGGAVDGFKQVADALAKLESPAERSSLAMQVFGEEGLKLGPLLAQGSRGVEAFTAEALKLGIAFDRVDAAKVEQANAALARVGGVAAGLGNQLAIQLAPFITAAADEFVRMASDGTSMGDRVTSAIEGVAQGIALATDVANGLWGAIKLGAAIAVEAFGFVLDVVARVAQALQAVVNAIPGVDASFGDFAADLADGVDRLADGLLRSAGESLKAPSASGQVTAFFDRIRSGADRAAAAIAGTGTALNGMGEATAGVALKVDDFTKKLEGEVASFGKSAEEAELYKLKLAGASDQQLATAQSLLAQKTAMEDAKRILEAAATPLEKYQQDLAKLRTALDLGVVDKAQFAKGADKLKKDLAGSGSEGPKFAGAMELGSAEAYSTVARFKAGGASGDAARDTARNTAAALDESRIQTILLRQLTRTEAQAPVFSF